MGKKPLSLQGIPNLDQLLREAERLGCTVAKIPNTGEVSVSHPRYHPQRLRLNARRKDGNRALVGWLRELQG